MYVKGALTNEHASNFRGTRYAAFGSIHTRHLKEGTLDGTHSQFVVCAVPSTGWRYENCEATAGRWGDRETRISSHSDPPAWSCIALVCSSLCCPPHLGSRRHTAHGISRRRSCQPRSCGRSEEHT